MDGLSTNQQNGWINMKEYKKRRLSDAALAHQPEQPNEFNRSIYNSCSPLPLVEDSPQPLPWQQPTGASSDHQPLQPNSPAETGDSPRPRGDGGPTDQPFTPPRAGAAEGATNPPRSLQKTLRQNRASRQAALARLNEAWGNNIRQDVIFLRLSEQSALITNTILTHPALRSAIRGVKSNGCELSPWWANGGLMLFPYDSDELESSGPDISFTREHVVLAACDLSNFGQALLEIPIDERPHVLLEDSMSIADMLMSSDEESEVAASPSTNPAARPEQPTAT